MRSITRRGFIATSASVAALGLASCDSTSPSSDGAGSAPSDMSANLRYAIWDKAQAPVMEQIVEAFNKEYPNIKVNVDVSSFGSYWTKLQTEAASDNLPDVFWMNPPSILLYALGGQLMPLTDMIDAGEINESDYTPSVWEIYTVEGTQYGVPKDNDAMAIWYSKSLLEKYGVDEPTSSWKWADLLDSARAVTEGSGGETYGFTGTVAKSGNHSWYNSAHQAGGFILGDDLTTIGYDQPGTVEGVKFWADLIAEGLSPTIQQLTDTDFDAWFTSGKVAMVAAGSWQTKPFSEALGDDLGVVQWAAGSNGSPTCVSGLSNVLPAKGKNTEASKAFLKFLGSKEAALIQAKAGIVIPAFNGARDPFFESVEGLDLSIFDEAIANGFPNPHTKNTSAWQKFEREKLMPVFQGKADVQSTCQELQAELTEMIAKE